MVYAPIIGKKTVMIIINYGDIHVEEKQTNMTIR
jgi:hypothetical protein